MFGAAFGGGHQLQQLVVVQGAAVVQGRQGHFAAGEGAGLVEDEVVDVGENLQHCAVLHQDAVAGTLTRGHGNGHGGGKAKSAGAGDDEHRHRGHQGQLQIGVDPIDEREGGQGEGGGHEPGHDAVGGALDGCLGGLGLFHQMDDAPQGSVAQSAGDLHYQGSGTVDGAGRDLVAGALLHRAGFAAEHGFVHHTLAFQHDAVGGNLGAGLHQHPVDGADAADGDGLFGAIREPDGHPRLEIEQPLGGGHRMAFGHCLQITAHQDHEDEVDHGVEIDLVARGVGDGHPARIGPGDGGADGDRQVHAQMAGAQGGPGAFEKGPAGIEEGGGGEQEAHPMEQAAEFALVGAGVEGDGDPQQVHHGEPGEDDAVKQGAVALFDFALGGFGVEGDGRVTDPGQVFENLREADPAVVPAYQQAFGRKVDPCRKHAGQTGEAVFDQPDAGGAVDAFHQQMDLFFVALAMDELLLDLLEVIELEILGWLRRRGELSIFRGALIETFEPGFVDRLAHRLAAEAAELPGLAVDLGGEGLVRGEGKAAVIAAFPLVTFAH